MRKRVTEECAENPHLSAGGASQVQTYYLETRACTQPFFDFFCIPKLQLFLREILGGVSAAFAAFARERTTRLCSAAISAPTLTTETAHKSFKAI